MRPSIESILPGSNPENINVYKAVKQVSILMQPTQNERIADSSHRGTMIVKSEVRHMYNDDMEAQKMDELLKESRNRDTIAKSIIFKTAQSGYEKEGPCLQADPVSLIISNIPTFKGGRSNPWMESMQDQTVVGYDRGDQHLQNELQTMFV